MNERTLVIIKPDAVARRLVGEITSRFENKGLQLLYCRMIKEIDHAMLDMHYVDLVKKPYYPLIKESMTMGPVVVQVWQGPKAIQIVRKLLGATDPKDAAPGTIRGDLAIDIGRNLCHASDSASSAVREICLWLSDEHERYDTVDLQRNLLVRD